MNNHPVWYTCGIFLSILLLGFAIGVLVERYILA